MYASPRIRRYKYLKGDCFKKQIRIEISAEISGMLLYLNDNFVNLSRRRQQRDIAYREYREAEYRDELEHLRERETILRFNERHEIRIVSCAIEFLSSSCHIFISRSFCVFFTCDLRFLTDTAYFLPSTARMMKISRQSRQLLFECINHVARSKRDRERRKNVR